MVKDIQEYMQNAKKFPGNLPFIKQTRRENKRHKTIIDSK